MVGVNLISPVNDVVATVTTPTYTSSVVSLTGVLTIIFVTVIILGAVAWIKCKLVPLESNLHRITSQIQGSLSALAYGNPELNLRLCFSKCAETRGFASYALRDDGIVRYSFEKRRLTNGVSRNNGLKAVSEKKGRGEGVFNDSFSFAPV